MLDCIILLGDFICNFALKVLQVLPDCLRFEIRNALLTQSLVRLLDYAPALAVYPLCVGESHPIHLGLICLDRFLESSLALILAEICPGRFNTGYRPFVYGFCVRETQL